MRVLVVNCGSSTLKFQLIDIAKEEASPASERYLARGVIEPLAVRRPSIFGRVATHIGTP